MNKRPLSVTIVSWLFIVAGSMGLLYHLSEIKQGFRYQLVLVSFVRILAILGGVFMLYGFNWARWLLIVWLIYHVALSALHSTFEIVFHAVLLGLVAYLLFRPQSSAYFRRRTGNSIV